MMQENNTLIFGISLKALKAVGITCLFSWIFAYLATNVYRDYSFGLFIWLPLILGISSTLIYGFTGFTHRKELRTIAYWTLFIFCLGLLLFAWEGLICLLMAAPIGFFFTWVGYRIGYEFLKRKIQNQKLTIILLFISVPTFMGFENITKSEDHIRSIITTVEINAPIEKVWKNVVSFPQLKKPTEFIFKTGIAYPINATINGNGVGAIRRCNFSTGSFVEPITVWNEPNILEFSVLEQPETMKELSFYDIRPNHLEGYWVSKKGQFKLSKLPNGHTLLIGTTWYLNKIKPGLYWSLWSDYIVHKIHRRVLEHIKTHSESNS